MKYNKVDLAIYASSLYTFVIFNFFCFLIRISLIFLSGSTNNPLITFYIITHIA